MVVHINLFDFITKCLYVYVAFLNIDQSKKKLWFLLLKMNKSNAAICKRIIQHDRVVYKNADLFTLENQHNSLFIKIEEKIHR